MVLLALASLWHWTQREDCTEQNLSIGHWQVSRVYSLLGQGENALRHAERSLADAEGLAPIYVAYAHEAMARAALAMGEGTSSREHLAKAVALAESVTDPEEKKLLAADLQALRARA